MGARPGIAVWSVGLVAVVAAAIVVATGRSGVEAGGRPGLDSGLASRSLAVPTRPRLPWGCPVSRSRWRPQPGQDEGRLWVAFGPAGGVYRVPAENVAADGSLGVEIGWQRGPGYAAL